MNYNEIIDICKVIGIENFAGLKWFEKEYCSQGQDLLQALRDYKASLGEGWCMV